MQERQTLTSEERLWAGLAHGSALVFFLGPILSTIVWFSQRKHSPFARFHALQAMVYQVLAFWVWSVVIPVALIVALLLMIVLGGAKASASEADALFGAVFPAITWGTIFLTFGGYSLLGIIGAVAVLTGHDFRYPLIGRALARHVEYGLVPQAAISEEKEAFVAASVSHGSCIMALWGILMPLVVWITQKDHSPFLRFQALQATIYQAIGIIAYVAWMVVYMLMSFGMHGLSLMAFPPSTSGASSGNEVLAGFMFIIPMLCLLGVFFIVRPLYQLFGFIAALRVLKGSDYHYPVLGGYLARRMPGPLRAGPQGLA